MWNVSYTFQYHNQFHYIRKQQCRLTVEVLKVSSKLPSLLVDFKNLINCERSKQTMHTMFILQSQLSQSHNKVEELTKDLTMERSVNETAKVLYMCIM